MSDPVSNLLPEGGVVRESLWDAFRRSGHAMTLDEARSYDLTKYSYVLLTDLSAIFIQSLISTAADDGSTCFHDANGKRFLFAIGGVFSGALLGGEGAPDNGLGSDGNVYLDVDTARLYTKVSGVWQSGIIIKGEDGVQSSDNSVTDIIALSRAEYDALSPPDETTFYIVID